MSTITTILPTPPNGFSTQISTSSVSSSDLSIELDSTSGLGTEGVGQLLKKDADGNLVAGSVEFVHWTNVSGNTITFSDTGDRGITGSDSGAQAYVADDYFEVWVSSYYTPSGIREQINDTNRNELVKFSTTASAVNELTITNAATGNAPEISATGGDTNIDLKLKGKGTGTVEIYNPTSTAYEAAVGETGWIPAGETWTYASSTTFTIAGVDLTTKYTAGTKIKLTQTTDKYFYVVKSSFSTDTTVVIRGGTDYTLANAAITSPMYSYMDNPKGHPIWFNYTPTLGASGSMTWTSTTISVAKFRVTKDTCDCMWSILGTTGGTTSNALIVTLPINALEINSGVQHAAGPARINESTTVGGFVYVNAADAIQVRKYDSSNWTLDVGKGFQGSLTYLYTVA